MGFYADLHIHSRYSRATSPDGDLEHMAYWACKKGVAVLGTGDFTHPAWLKEIEEKLIPAEPGLFRLRPELEKEVEGWLGSRPSSFPRFLLEVEISTIYKKDGRTRKVHHLIYAPDLEKARRLILALERIGNLASDGRPILGLDSRHLLEIALGAGEGCYLIPAHIWTPWFAALGSMSGFDSIEECYGDLAAAIFAVETGLSSDPPMNRRLSSLDRFTLVSNSDAHSPPRIGREACLFVTALDYFAMRRALETREGYGGTVEFFAEEGKYHLDGHRKCGVCLTPEETRGRGGLCPACGKPLTLGVMHRVTALADRGEAASTPGAVPFRSLIPLEEVLAELRGSGARSKTVQEEYQRLTREIGPELFLLDHAPLEAIEREGSSLVAEALARMRQGRVIRNPGFDGQYGAIRLFAEGEIERRTGGAMLFDLFEVAEPVSKPEPPPIPRESAAPEPTTPPREIPRPPRPPSPAPILPAPAPPLPAPGGLLAGLDPEQRSAAELTEGQLAIIAGPGTGKTRTLTYRLAHLIAHRGVPPEQCLAITFTRRAAREMAERLQGLLPGQAGKITVLTFHALGLSILEEHGDRLGLPRPLRVASEADRRNLLMAALPASEREAERLASHISRQKRDPASASSPADRELARALEVYERELRRQGLVDFDDLIALPLRLLTEHADLKERYRDRFRWISVDEFQDLDLQQYRLLRLLAPADGNLCAIGDPDQSIYGFRGADSRCFQRFQEDFPAARTVQLTRNYRSARAIVNAASDLIAPASLVAERRLAAQLEGPEHIEIHECSTSGAEAEFIVHSIERLIGGSAFFSLDSGRVESHEGEALSFGDFAVLYRTEAQAEPLVEALQRSGMPFQKRSHRPLGEVAAAQAVLREMDRIREEPSGERPVLERLELAAASVRAACPEVDHYLPPLREAARRCPADLARFRSELALGVDVDLWDPRAEGVALLTLHAAKGLEFPVVFIAGCEDGLLPLRWGSGEADLAEERRIFFVGMTRARMRLILTWARRRALHGPARPAKRSPFLEGIEKYLREVRDAGGRRSARAADSPYRQLTIFDMLQPQKQQ